MGNAASAPRGPISHKKILQKNYVFLRDNLMPRDLLDYLFENEVLERREYNELRHIRSDDNLTRALIEAIEQKNRHKFGKFLLSLEQSHRFVIDYLDKQTGVSLREEFQVDSPIQLDQVILKHSAACWWNNLLENNKVINKFGLFKKTQKDASPQKTLQKEKQDLISKLEELEKTQGRRIEEIQSKHKELEKAQDTETERIKSELLEENSRITRALERETEELKTQITDHEERIKNLERSQRGEKTQPKIVKQDSTSTDDEKLFSLHVAASNPDDMDNFFKAVRRGKLVEVKRLLSSGVVDVNCRGDEGRTPVMVAAFYGQESVFDFLLKKKDCDLSAVNDNGNNVLHYACQGGSEYIVKELIDKHNFDIECRGSFERTPIMMAVEKGHMSVVEVLKKEEANLNTLVDGKSNILHVACTGGDIDMVKYVISMNIIDLESRGNHGRTPLLYATYKGHLPVVEILQNEGANFNTVDDHKNNILHVACIGGHVKMVKFVRSLKIADINCRESYGRTPLMKAVYKGHKSVVVFLKEEGADFKTIDGCNNNILHVACIGGHIDMVRYILSLNITSIQCRGQYGRTPLMCAVEKGHLSVVKVLMTKRLDCNKVDDNFNNILHVACIGGHLDTVKHLVSLKEVKGFERRLNKDGKTPLQLAQVEGHNDVVSFLQSRKYTF